MSLSKQLYIIISFIFFIIFTGNFLISVKNTKEYLEVESATKAQDTATSLGMSIRPLIKQKDDPEIESIIRAISNSGFYKELRLEDANFTISQRELLDSSTHIDLIDNWKITKVFVDPKFGKVEKIESDAILNKKLEQLENITNSPDNTFSINDDTQLYRYIPSTEYKNGGNITFEFTAVNGDNKINTFANITINKIIFQEKRDVKFEYVPSWFINLIKMDLEEKFSEISDGWNTAAIIYVSANPGDAYAKLYEQAKNSIIYSAIAFVLSIIFLFIFVQYLLKPLKRIEKLAKDIAQGNFRTISQLPWTTEIKNVAISMNDMSVKIENIINKLNKNLEQLSKKLSQDELTKLPLKSTFETDMKEMFIQKANGYVFNVRIDDLAQYAKKHTNSEVNKFIVEFANTLASLLEEKNLNIKAYRFFGSEFVLLAKDCDYECAKKVCNLLKQKFELLSEEFEKKEIAHIGATPFNTFGTTPEMLQAANEAFEKAKLIGPNEFFIRDKADLSRDMEEWRDLVFDIIDNKLFNIDYINSAYDLTKDEKEIVMQEAFTHLKDKENNDIPIGTFVSIAEKYEKIIDLDKAVISKVIEYINIHSIKHPITINLSINSICNNEFIIWLQKTITKHKEIAPLLAFSITAYAVAKDVEVFKKFCDYIHNSGSKIIVKRFETKFIPLDNLKDFNLDFIRLAREYTNEIQNDSSKQSFVESIQELSTLLNIKVIAENAKSDEEFDMIKKLHVYAASR
jgi:EAL domain-containing protein (putative c-di-GMP-specific phosphodiesterase class I)/GGDEF domain-containing protein